MNELIYLWIILWQYIMNTHRSSSDSEHTEHSTLKQT
jgi:hypothetical protein